MGLFLDRHRPCRRLVLSPQLLLLLGLFLRIGRRRGKQRELDLRWRRPNNLLPGAEVSGAPRASVSFLVRT